MFKFINFYAFFNFLLIINLKNYVIYYKLTINNNEIMKIKSIYI
jgi:hypothetical protein